MARSGRRGFPVPRRVQKVNMHVRQIRRDLRKSAWRWVCTAVAVAAWWALGLGWVTLAVTAVAWYAWREPSVERPRRRRR